MRWFRAAAISTTTVTQLIAFALVAMIASLCTNSSHAKSLDSDPNYNGTLMTYIIILAFQFAIITTSLLGFYIAFKNWQNNYQMDHDQRTRFVSFIALWALFNLGNMGIAIFAIVRGKEPQQEMAYLYEVFAKYNQDTKLVANIEKYQREKGCCGIYGPDDWMMVQLRSNMGGGGGGGGYQSLDYGFKQNPSTGKCHLVPPTIPMGCGRIMLEQIHLELATYAGIMILESLIGLAAASFSAYCFFYWLEKEVIVIPEDEVSNLIILEPDSSTDTSMPAGSGGNGGDPYLGPPGDFPPGGYPEGYPGSRGSSYIPGYSGYGPDGGPSQHPSNWPGGGPEGPGGTSGTAGPAGSNPGAIPSTGQGTAPQPGENTGGESSTPQAPSGVAPNSGPNDALSRYHYQANSASGYASSKGSSMNRRGTYLPQNGKYLPQRAPTILQPQMNISFRGGEKPHSTKHFLHNQEKALGGKLLGEMHVDHSNDSQPELGDSNGKGKKKHHATIAVVRNKKAPKPKKFLADNSGSNQGHGQTGHLAADIAAMSGRAASAKLDDVVLPVGHGHNTIGPGGYLRQLEKQNKIRDEAAVEQASGVRTAAGSNMGGVEMQNILSSMLDPVAQAHARNQGVAQYQAPLVQPHLASASHNGEHQNAHYLPAGAGGSHQNAHYLPAGAGGSHENAHYLPAGAGGSHQNAHYLEAGSAHRGSHQNAHYLEAGSAHRGSHQNAHYLEAGSAHRGSHQNAHYLEAGSAHRGSHQNAHYLEAGSAHRGSHQNAHYLEAGSAHRGSHQNAHYLEAGSAHRGSHQNAHYLEAGSSNRGPHNENGQHLNAASAFKNYEKNQYMPPPPAHGRSVERPSANTRFGLNPRDEIPHPHQLHKSRYEPEFTSHTNDARRYYSVRTLILYKNPKPMVED